MSKLVSVEVFNIEELSEGARNKAYYDWLEGWEYSWSQENKTTLEKFIEIFPIEVNDWSYGNDNYVSWYFTEEEAIESMSGIRLLTYLYNNYFSNLYKGKYFSLWSKKEKSPNNPNVGKLKSRYSKVMLDDTCVLTGYYIDLSILDPIYKFLKKPSDDITFHDLMEQCLEQWAEDCGEDYNNSSSMEHFIEESKNNEWQYLSDGTQFN